MERDRWSPYETLTAEEAIGAYCMGGAYAGHAESRVGSLKAGKLADFVVLSGNPTLEKMRVERLCVGGKWMQHNATLSGQGVAF